jgi:hypothetical protein
MTVEQGLFKRYFVGRDNFIWWLGQIVDETKWSGNIPGYRTPTTEDHKGFEYRYKVRIMGYHTAVPSELSDDDLPWASLMYPVTAGAGTGGLSQTPNLKQGMFVYGFFLDGEDAQQPIIMGVLGYNDYTQVLNNIPDAGFLPFEGYRFREETVAQFSLRTKKENPLGKQSGSPPTPEIDPLNPQGNTGKVNNAKIQGVTGYDSLTDGASKLQKDKGQKEHTLPVTSVCEKQPLGKIQLEIQNLVKDIEKARKSLSDWETRVSTRIDKVQRWIEDKVKFAADKISQGIKWIVTEIEKQTINRVNNRLKDTYFLLFPNERPILKTAVETANDLLACLFRNIIKNLYKLVSKLLLGVIDKLINVPICFAEQFLGVILGSIFNDILSGVASVFSTISGIVGTAFDIVDDILGFITDVFSFLTCDTKPECPEVDTWSPWDGPGKTATLDVQGLFDQVKNFASNISDTIQDAEGAVTGAVSSIQGTISSAVNGFDTSPLGGVCNVGAFRCGPPIVEFFGGEGSGAAGNVIIGFTGEILGVDIISEGGNYAEPPFVKFKDNCGKGSGAVGRAILEFDPDVKPPIEERVDSNRGCLDISGLKNGRVVAVVIEEPGKNYLYSYDGSEGGGGRTFANYCETMVRRSTGCYDLPYVSGQTIQLDPGDWIKYPNSTAAVRVTEAQTVTAPTCGDYDSSDPPPGPPPIFRTPDPLNPPKPVDDVNYPIDLDLDDVEILDPGYDYQPGDPIVFIPTPSDDPNEEIVPPSIVDFEGLDPTQPDAVVETVDPQGGITKITILNPRTFTSYPNIFVISNSGFNAKLAPRFTINRLTPEQVEARITTGQPILSVIDCVGKIPPKQQFDIVP